MAIKDKIPSITQPYYDQIVLPPTSTAVPEALGAGFRFSIYGPGYDPGAEYWAGVGQQMAVKFPNARPQAIWIVGNDACRPISRTQP